MVVPGGVKMCLRGKVGGGTNLRDGAIIEVGGSRFEVYATIVMAMVLSVRFDLGRLGPRFAMKH
jgi:hypothetical protein